MYLRAASAPYITYVQEKIRRLEQEKAKLQQENEALQQQQSAPIPTPSEREEQLRQEIGRLELQLQEQVCAVSCRNAPPSYVHFYFVCMYVHDQ